jgi:nucleoid-associated protein YgaU
VFDREGKEQVVSQHRARAASGPVALLPPLPVRGNEAAAPPLAAAAAENDPPALVVQPLPGAEPAQLDAAQANAVNEDIAPGQFVANDIIDEGEKLLAKYQHGATGPNIVGPRTRARRATVNVICVARCPFGGHFTTGSDDGICRVWEDSDENGVEIIDHRASGVSNDLPASAMGRRVARSARSGK